MRAASGTPSGIAWTLVLFTASALLGFAICWAWRAQPDRIACPAAFVAPSVAFAEAST